jgi:RNA polymerase sigma-70 factor, ECF subfamily
MTNGSCRRMTTAPLGATFEDTVIPHLDAGRRLARWLIRNEHDAEDAVQEASLRAFRYFRTFTGGNGRAWFLSIVRNSCRSWREPAWPGHADPFDEQQHSIEATTNPEMLLLYADNATLLDRALDRLPARFRNLLILRELQGLTYHELADELNIPMGTVMSGLSRARRALRAALDEELNDQRTPGTGTYDGSLTAS